MLLCWRFCCSEHFFNLGSASFNINSSTGWQLEEFLLFSRRWHYSTHFGFLLCEWGTTFQSQRCARSASSARVLRVPASWRLVRPESRAPRCCGVEAVVGVAGIVTWVTRMVGARMVGAPAVSGSSGPQTLPLGPGTMAQVVGSWCHGCLCCFWGCWACRCHPVTWGTEVVSPVIAAVWFPVAVWLQRLGDWQPPLLLPGSPVAWAPPQLGEGARVTGTNAAVTLFFHWGHWGGGEAVGLTSATASVLTGAVGAGPRAGRPGSKVPFLLSLQFHHPCAS